MSGTHHLRVLHVVNQVAAHGGAEVSLGEMLSRLPDHGIESIVQPLFAIDDGETAASLTRPGVDVLPPLGQTGPSAVAGLVRVVGATRPDVVHTTLFDADLYGRLAAAVRRVPTLVSLVNEQYSSAARENAPAAWKLDLVRRVDAALARHLTTRLHAITHAVATAKVDAFRVPPDKVTVVPRGRDRRRLGQPRNTARQRLRDELCLPDGVRVVLNVARHERQKGHVHLVRAFARLAEDLPDVVLLIAGREGNATPQMRAAIEQCDVGDRVRLLGRRTDVPDLLRVADVFAFSSLWEGLGGSVLEAMALEVPVVAFDIAPVREVLGGHGCLVPAGDEVALAQAVRGVLEDPAAARERALAARRRFDQEYDLDNVVQRMAELYRQVADG